jgi:glycine/D-amino acid oxidase-like deaminating enzyme
VPAIATVASDAMLPRQSDVVVIGGGIAGIATALELAERGIATTVVEKGEIAAEQSSRNWGWCRQMGRDPREIPLIRVSLDLWRGMNARIGADTGYTDCGILYLCETEAELADRADWYRRIGQPNGLDIAMIDGAETERRQPGASRRWKGSLFSPRDGRAEPFVAVAAMAEGARARGARIFTRTAARGLETSAGRVSAVVTEKGATACNAVVLAGGAWSRRFCHNAGIALPQLTVVNSVMRTAPIDTGLSHSCSGGRFAIRRRADGGYTITHRHLSIADIVPDSFRLFRDFLPVLQVDWAGLRLRLGRRFVDEARLKRRWQLDEASPFEVVRILDPAPDESILGEAAASLIDCFPAFRPMRIVERWGGAIDASPDAIPVISAVESLPGFHLATGFSGHGFGLGPGAGKLMAEIVTGERPCVDPAPFRYTRFRDGTRPQPTTGL